MVVTTPNAGRTGTRREPAWDALRIGFVLLVVTYHATHLGPELHPELIERRFSFDHQVGASLLLVVSAYFACATLGRHSAGRYWWARVARLLPAFLVVVPVAWLTLHLLGPADWGDPPAHQILTNWLMLGNWDDVRYPWLDPAYWTLPLQLMAFTAAAVLSTTRWGTGPRLRVLLWTLLLVPLLLWPLRAAPGGLSDPPWWYGVVVDGLGFHRLHLFVAGIAIWLWSTRRMGPAHALALLTLCGAAQFLHSFAPGPDGTLEIDVVAVAGVCTGIAVVALASRLPNPGSWTPAPLAVALRRLAGISYGVYLVHQTIGYVLMRRLQDVGVGPMLQSAAMLGSALALGWLLTRLVERPAHGALMSAWDRLTARGSRSSPAV
ncbi:MULTISPECIES: acyltransferase family protein [Pseudonocardia]|uniref:acyltransferase family protein n=1 Tax=Pseudonocardia TaxID=1847 RepID=UPI000A281C04|nr:MULTISPECIES: acyltransferase [Pseudonocardia]